MQTIMIAGGTLFAVAAQALGDATQWYRIAEANGLTDPMIYGLTSLVIPDAATSAGDGLPD